MSMKMYCMKCKRKWEATGGKHVTKGKTKFLVAEHTCGTKCYRILGRA